MSSACEICGRVADSTTLHGLTGLAGESRSGSPTVQLCDRCLEIRECRTWPSGEAETSRLVDALRDRSQPKTGRYAFLTEGTEDVHLVRLRQDWLERSTDRSSSR